MSNITEKILLTGFSFFIVLLILSNFLPLFNKINLTRDEEIYAMEKYINLIEDIDYGMSIIEKNINSYYEKIINPPKGLNITISSNIIITEIQFTYFIQRDILTYKMEFFPRFFKNFEPFNYLLTIQNDSDYIIINFSLLVD